MPMKSLVRKQTLVDDVTRELRLMILEREIQPGEFLPPRKDLATQFGVGLSTIQEAIQALSAVGMLESRPGKGTWVREDALDTLIHPAVIRTRLGELQARQVYEARFVIEIALTELAAGRATPEDIDQIWDALADMEATVEDVISEMLKLPDVKEDSISIQRAIAQAIEQGDPDAARQAAVDHMKHVEHWLDIWTDGQA
jgi:DNA-binding FadR family transcriptional regulator